MYIELVAEKYFDATATGITICIQVIGILKSIYIFVIILMKAEYNLYYYYNKFIDKM